MNYTDMGRRIADRLKICLLGLTLLIIPAAASSQNSYPVHATVQTLPPYGMYLTDYYSGTRDRLIITLLNRDQGQDILQVKLRMTVKNGSSFSLQSRDELYYPAITLERGVPLRLTNADIVPYLAPDRIAMTGTLQNGKLPVGMTEFHVQVLDYATGRPLSAVAVGRAWLEIKQPPMLDLPAKNELVESRPTQHVRFQWMPRHQGLASTMYEFTIKELPDNGAAPQSAFMYGNIIYQTETRATTLNYTHLEPELIAGKQYGWQVKATAMDGMDEVGMFENNGYSEIGWFRMSDNCPAPLNVRAQAGHRKMTLNWESTPEQLSFKVEYRPKSDNDLYDWTSEQTFDNEFTVEKLTPGWTYEYRVGTVSMSNQSVFSPVGQVTLPDQNEERVAKCGAVPVVDLSNTEPNETLAPGDVVTIGGDFPMTLTAVSSQGNGWYSGEGWITMPWIFEVQVAVKFDRLRVNTDNIQIDGEVETKTDPNASQIANTNALDYGGSAPVAAGIVFQTVTLDFTLPDDPIAEFDPETGELMVYDTNGEPHVVAEKQNDGKSIFPMIIEDDQGNQYLVSVTESDGSEEDNIGELTVERAEGLYASEFASPNDSGNIKIDKEAASKRVDSLVIILQQRIREHLKDANDDYPRLAFQHEKVLPSITKFDYDVAVGGQHINGKLYIGRNNFEKNRGDEDILATIYHEYMHYISWVWVYGYKYPIDPVTNYISTVKVECFERRMQSENDFYESIYNDFSWYWYQARKSMPLDHLLPFSYKDMNLEQQLEFEEYIKEEKLSPQEKCFPYEYQPSNYPLDEINAYTETLNASNKGLFKMSQENISDYYKMINKYENEYNKAKNYETENQLNGQGEKISLFYNDTISSGN